MDNEIILGETHFRDDQIVSSNLLLVQSLDGNELQYNTTDFVVDTVTPSDLSVYEYGTPVEIKHNGILLGRFYVSSITRTGKTRYKVACISAIGLLSNSQHYGGIYTKISVPDILKDVIGNAIPYTVDPIFNKVTLHGWLPVATRRDNLHQVLFAIGGAAVRDDAGNVFISYLKSDNEKNIPDNRIFMKGTVKYPEKTTSVSVSEHAYNITPIDEEVTLFNGEIRSDKVTTPKGNIEQGGIVLFDSPIHNLTVTGSTILESGVNYAVLSPGGTCVLKGKKYTHTVHQVTRPTASPTTRSIKRKDNEVTVEDATLVSFFNGENIADRVMDYYSSAKTVNVDIVMEDEVPGSTVSLTDPFGDQTSGIIKSMDANLSNILKASCEIISDYFPPQPGGDFSKVTVLTTNQVFTAPKGAKKLRVIVIGGGQGGYGGETGKPGESTPGQYSQSPPGKGGAGGKTGDGGKILISTIPVNPRTQTTFDVSIGAGGIGGEPGKPGLIGADTKFGNLSSGSGEISSSGFTDLINNVTYGRPGLIPGMEGGTGTSQDGKPGNTIKYEGKVYTSGTIGTDYGERFLIGINPNRYQYWLQCGGGGGGAAVGANGKPGQNGEKAGSEWVGGKGGDGATATIPGKNATVPGCGGEGGHGGGGGGGGGIFAIDGSARDASVGGAGGTGSKGGNGAPGCVIVYY